MRKVAIGIVVLMAAAWLLSRPRTLTAADLPEHRADAVAGERVFWAGGCASCHATPVDGVRAKGEAKLKLGGGLEFDTQYGIFRAPNISPDPDSGIGGWTTLAFVNAMQRGVSPDGRHYYPAFPYTSYARMATTDIIDLKAYLDTLPAVSGRVADHALGFPYNVRRGLGLWKRLYLDEQPVMAIDPADEQLARGQALVEGAGHCGECHTPRNALGALQHERWLSGAPNPDGKGSIPNITPASATIGDWSVDDLAYYFESGLTPDFDTVGGSMVAVQENLAQLSDADRQAVGAYLKSVPAVD